MVQHKPTPEEQLLKLIENSGDASEKSSSEAAKPRDKGETRPSFPGFQKISGMMDYWKQAFQKKNAAGPVLHLETVLDIRWANRALIIMVFMALAYLVMDLSFFKPGRRNFFNQVSVSEPIFPLRSVSQNAAHDRAFYLQGLKRRTPFLAPGMVSQAAAPLPGAEGTPAASSAITDALQGTKLVGISLGEEPLAMMEDTATGRTYFVKKGQEFKGIKVQQISKEKVTVTYEGQEAELF